MVIDLSDDTITNMIDRVTKDDILILELLLKKKCINSHTGMTKNNIINEIEGLTDFKFQISSNRLELALLITKTNASKSMKYYITKAGSKLVKQYKRDVIDILKEI
jgi:predicted MarR family transcription regulator